MNNQKSIYYWLFIALFFALAVFQVSQNIGKPCVRIWDEASGAANAVEMMQTESYWIVLKDGEPTHQVDSKPPFALWAKVLSYKLFGVNEFAVRFPTLVSAILIFLLFIWFGKCFVKDNLFVIAALFIIGITAGFNTYHVARTGDPDTLLMLFVNIYFFAFFILIEKYPGKRITYLIALGASVFLAIFTKSIAGLAPLAGIFVYALFQKNTYKLLKDYRFHLTWISSLGLIAAYYLIREQFDPGYIKEGLFREIGLFGDYPATPKHPEKSFYVKYLFETAFYPFLYFVLPTAVLVLIFGKNKMQKRLIIYSFTALAFFTLGHSMAVTKNEWYISPAYPFLWTLSAVSIAEFYNIIKEKIPQNYILYPLNIIIIVTLFVYYGMKYKDIYDYNNRFKSGIVYKPQREGDFMRKIKSDNYNYKNIKVVSDVQPRQIKFYIRKYEYERGDSTIIYKTTDLVKPADTVLVCVDKLEKELDTIFITDTIEKGKYCNLLGIKSYK